MRHPEQAGFVALAFAQERKGSVVVATPHSEAVAFSVEGHEGSEDEIKCPCWNGHKGFHWRLEDTEAIGDETCFGCVGKEPEAVAIQSIENRQEDLFAAFPGHLDQWRGVLFAIVGEEGGDALCAAKPLVATEMMREQVGMFVVLTFRERATLLPDFTT